MNASAETAGDVAGAAPRPLSLLSSFAAIYLVWGSTFMAEE